MQDAAWAAVLARRAGGFFYGVRTTGIYCRPECPSRRPRRENVAFFESCEAAEAAGFRACKRCDPRGVDAEAGVVAAACRRIEGAEGVVGLAELAAEAGYSRFHFQRVFKARMGVTPRQYAAGLRAERVRGALAEGTSVTEAIYAAGYGAASRFYAEAAGVLGMAPAAARKGGAGKELGMRWRIRGWGWCWRRRLGWGLRDLPGGQRGGLVRDLRERFPRAELEERAGLDGMLERVVRIVEEGGGEDLPLDLRGTAFQLRVWRALREIPAGETESYAALAARVGVAGGARAVAGACAANAVAIAVPCHRVVRGDGGLAGYRWGVERKRAILQRERA